MKRAKELGWPNTYTFTKSLAESLIAKYGNGLPIAIVRPAIVETSVDKPFRGWNEGINTSASLSYLLGTFFRQLPTNERKRLDLIPVDAVCAGMTLIAAALVERRHDPLYQLATSVTNPCDMGRSIELTWLGHRKHYRAQEGLENWLRLRFDAIPVSKTRYNRMSAPAQKMIIRSIQRIMSPLSVKKPLAKTERNLERVEKLIQLFEPFILDNEHDFVADNVEKLSQALRARRAGDLRLPRRRARLVGVLDQHSYSGAAALDLSADRGAAARSADAARSRDADREKWRCRENRDGWSNVAIFLTGGTGYIGAHVAANLLERYDATLNLLVRGRDPQDAELRLWNALQLHMPFPEFYEYLQAKIRIFRGDLTEPRFGLDRDGYDRLMHTTDSVIHCAASLNRKSEKSCLNVNLRGTLEVVQLARRSHYYHGLQRFSTVSTVAVAGKRSHEIVTEDRSLEWDRSDYDPYARTKKFCEHMVRELLPDVPLTIFRPSIVLGDSRYPETTQFDMVRSFVFLAGLPVLPLRSRDKIDIVNVDFVADAIATLHMKPNPQYDTYHLSSGNDSQTLPGTDESAGRSAVQARAGVPADSGTAVHLDGQHAGESQRPGRAGGGAAEGVSALPGVEHGLRQHPSDDRTGAQAGAVLRVQLWAAEIQPGA